MVRKLTSFCNSKNSQKLDANMEGVHRAMHSHLVMQRLKAECFDHSKGATKDMRVTS